MRKGGNAKNPAILGFFMLSKEPSKMRGIESSLRAFVSMRAVRLLLRARAVINFLMRAASTL